MLIPINMRDGSVLAIGKENPEWNFSAPHGTADDEVDFTVTTDDFKTLKNNVLLNDIEGVL